MLHSGAASLPRAEEGAQTAGPSADGQQVLPSGATSLPSAEERAQAAASSSAGQQVLPSGAAASPRAEERAQAAWPSSAGQQMLPSHSAASPRAEERAQAAWPSSAGQQVLPSGAASLPRAEERAQAAWPSSAGQQVLPSGATSLPRAEERAQAAWPSSAGQQVLPSGAASLPRPVEQTASPSAAGQQMLPSGAATLPRPVEHDARSQQQTPARVDQGPVVEQHAAMGIDAPSSGRPEETRLSTQAGGDLAGELLLSSATPCPWAGLGVCRVDWIVQSTSCSHQASAEKADTCSSREAACTACSSSSRGVLRCRQAPCPRAAPVEKARAAGIPQLPGDSTHRLCVMLPSLRVGVGDAVLHSSESALKMPSPLQHLSLCRPAARISMPLCSCRRHTSRGCSQRIMGPPKPTQHPCTRASWCTAGSPCGSQWRAVRPNSAAAVPADASDQSCWRTCACHCCSAAGNRGAWHCSGLLGVTRCVHWNKEAATCHAEHPACCACGVYSGACYQRPARPATLLPTSNADSCTITISMPQNKGLPLVYKLPLQCLGWECRALSITAAGNAGIGSDKVQGNPDEGPGPSQQQDDNMEDAGNDSPGDDMSDGGGDNPQQGALAGAGQSQMLTAMSLGQDAPYLNRPVAASACTYVLGVFEQHCNRALRS